MPRLERTNGSGSGTTPLIPLALLVSAACGSLGPAAPDSRPAEPGPTAIEPDREPGREVDRTETHALPGAEVAIYQPAGAVVIEPTTGPDVVVRITYFGPDAGEVRTRIERDDDGSEMSVVYPDTARRIIYPRVGPFTRSSFWIRGNGTFGHGLPRLRQITVARTGTGVRAYTSMRVAVPSGRELDIYLGAGSAAVRDVRGALEIDSRSATVDVRGTRGPLEIDTGSGDVRVEDVVGPLDVNTGSGDVELRRVRGPRVEVTTGTGDITGGSVTAPVLELRTGIGTIDVTAARARSRPRASKFNATMDS